MTMRGVIALIFRCFCDFDCVVGQLQLIYVDASLVPPPCEILDPPLGKRTLN